MRLAIFRVFKEANVMIPMEHHFEECKDKYFFRRNAVAGSDRGGLQDGRRVRSCINVVVDRRSIGRRPPR